MSSNQITTLYLFKYKSLKNKLWAFGMMQFAHGQLAGVKGLQFYKLMGSGKGLGFNPLPDWSTYALLQIWDSEEDAQDFIDNSELIKSYQSKTVEMGTVFMKNMQAHGEWSGKNPFEVSNSLDPSNEHIAVITRATIKNKFLLKFWKYVPTSQKPIENATGLIYTKGIGEMPIKQMATFSLWKDKESLNQFAYGSEEHKEAIKMTRTLGWYSEELFARFQPYKLIGNWSGIDLNL